MARIPDLPCATCGKLMWGGTTSLPVGQARCRPCRKADWQHGTAKGYRDNSCRCEACTQWNRTSRIDYNSRVRSGEIMRPQCLADGCDRPSASRTMCTMHYKRWATQNGMNRPPSSRWSDRARSNHHARRARMNGAKASDKVLVSKMIEARQTMCGWCGTNIDVSIEYPDRYSKSLDHTIPISRGGTHTLDNVTLMHLACNLSKGARPMPSMETSNGEAQRNAS